MGTTTNITRPVRTAAPRWLQRRFSPAPTDRLPGGLFVSELNAAGLRHITQDSFRGDASPGKLAALGELVLVRANPRASEVEALIRLPGGEPVLIDGSHGHVSIEVAARTREAGDAAAAVLKDALASAPPPPQAVSMAFWMQGPHGGQVRHREIDAPSFDDIAANYPRGVRAPLRRLVEMRAPETGRLILWRGAPGTGKSYALRALVKAWASWCSAHFVMDPDALFGHGGAYMLDVLTSGDDDDRWRLLILEDAGELIAADARAVAGQALSRLLNVADGLLGQGTRTLILVTTNEPVKRLHPATRRPGRCLADLEFEPFGADEANAWLAERGSSRRVDGPTALAELFAKGASDDAGDEPVRQGFGFARALAASERTA